MMQMLEFDNISKLYTLGQVGTGTLSRDLSRWWQTSVLKREDPYMIIGQNARKVSDGGSDLFWALRDISFKVDQGDVVGVIGKNGSGKSTLLKILSRITSPTKGVIKVRGKIASLLEIGTGFHPDLTGRDNIYMNGAILGMTRHEINRKLDEIIVFSGVEDHIDTPVKRYSSGMKVRLGFAVAAHLEPDILIVDEVLAVGDAEFQKKAIGKMQSVSKEDGRTVLFVSHNMNSVLQVCNRGIVLNEGKLVFDGEVNDAIDKYVSGNNTFTCFEGIDGTDEISLRKTRVYNKDNTNSFCNNSPIYVEMEVDLKVKLKDLIIGWNIFSQYNSPLARTDYNDLSDLNSLEPGRYLLKFEIPAFTLAPGNYKIIFDISQKGGKRFNTYVSNIDIEVIYGDEKYGDIHLYKKPSGTSIIHEKWIKDISCISSYR